MKPGLRSVFILAADVVITNDNTPSNLPGFAVTLAPNKSAKVKMWIPMFSGATGGVQFVFPPVVGASAGYMLQANIFNVNAATIVQHTVSGAAALVNDAMASSGFHYLEIESYIVADAAGATFQLLMAQNTADPLDLNIIAGASIEVLQF